MFPKSNLNTTRHGRHPTAALLTAALWATCTLHVTSYQTSTSTPITSSCDVSIGGPSVKVIPNAMLYVSEPNPTWFGNKKNEEESDNSSWTNANWLKSRFHFSFAEYSNQGNTNFGVLRVMNDDLVQPQCGFGTHGHANMEIITYIVHGELTHQDSMGTKQTLGRGSVQFMTAGTGVRHSEHNLGNTPLRFIQTWIVPKTLGLKPNYGSADGRIYWNDRRNHALHLVSSVDSSEDTPVKINQNVDGYAAELEMGVSTTIHLPAGRQGYLLCLEGSITVNGQRLTKYDASEIKGYGPVEIAAIEVETTENGDVAHFLMYIMPEEPGSGRSDII